MHKIDGCEIKYHEKSNRIYDIRIENEIIDKLIFPFNKFDITALEYKPFTRFTIAKSLDDLTNNMLSAVLNTIISDRSTGSSGEKHCSKSKYSEGRSKGSLSP